MATIAEMIYHKYCTEQGMKEIAIVSAVAHMVAEMGRYKALEIKRIKRIRDASLILKPLVRDTLSPRDKLIAAGLLVPSDYV